MSASKTKTISPSPKIIGSNQPRPFLLWQIINWVAITGLLLAAFFTVRFIYENVYLSLSNAYAIIVLSKDLDIEKIDATAFEKAQKALANKQIAPIPDKLRYIFALPAISTSTPVKSTNKL